MKKLRMWFIVTFVMGAIFIGGPVFEYTERSSTRALAPVGPVRLGVLPDHRFHGLHVTGGLIAFLLVLGNTYAARRFTPRAGDRAIVVPYYRHSVDVVWISLFATIYMIK